MIKYLLHSEIDKKQWDGCIEQSVNRLPYAYSWWLDIVSPGWEALVEDDYKAVMPLTGKSKYGFHYLYQPHLTQQLGVFSRSLPGSDIIDGFLEAIPAHYVYITIQLNSANKPTHKDFQYTSRKNFTLDLSGSYNIISAGYNRSCRRNLQKALHAGLTVGPGPEPHLFTRFVYNHLYRRIRDIQKSLYPKLQHLTTTSTANGTGKILGVYDRHGELLTAGWFVVHSGRCLSLVWASTPAGKDNNANFWLADHLIREKSGSDIIFDFTGSNLPGVAYFNAGFGSSESYYPAVKRNKLPWIVRLVKK